jgi:hypothetical protein
MAFLSDYHNTKHPHIIDGYSEEMSLNWVISNPLNYMIIDRNINKNQRSLRNIDSLNRTNIINAITHAIHVIK